MASVYGESLKPLSENDVTLNHAIYDYGLLSMSDDAMNLITDDA